MCCVVPVLAFQENRKYLKTWASKFVHHYWQSKRTFNGELDGIIFIASHSWLYLLCSYAVDLCSVQSPSKKEKMTGPLAAESEDWLHRVRTGCTANRCQGNDAGDLL